MATPKKKTIVKTESPKARYANGNKVFIICFAFAGSGLILEGEVSRVDSAQHPILSDSGKITGGKTFFSYIVYTAKGAFEVTQLHVYPSYLEAAKEFGKVFVHMLK